LSESFYRKWRPRSFAELAGQAHVATTLRNALATGRVAHAYLFAGPRGTGKTSTGRILAKALNCRFRRDGEPCNECDSCRSYNEARALDLVELDAASNRGIEEIRSLREKVAFAPGGDFKVYLIDEVHMLTDAAFNALLKTLEEPPPHVVFILATTEAHRVPATITSRCQRFDFHRVPLAAAIEMLQRICAAEDIACDAAALELLARAATGSLRDAENLLDQLATSYGKQLSVEMVREGLGLIDDARAARLARIAVAGGLGEGLALIGGVRDDGLDLVQFQKEVVRQLRMLLLAKSGVDPADGVTAEERQELAAVARDAPLPRLMRALRAFGEADLRADPSSTLPLDIALAEAVLEPEAAPARPLPSASTPSAPPQPSQRRGDPSPSGGAPRRPPPPAPRPFAPRAVANGAAPTPAVAQARALMPRIYRLAKERDIHTGALLNRTCDIIDVTDAEVVFGFKFESHLKRMREPRNMAVLEEVVGEALGRRLSVRCVEDPSVDPWRPGAPANSPLVQAAREMGAEVLSPNQEEEP
jgi:DNA polymerase-3 subunit gamma/tau